MPSILLSSVFIFCGLLFFFAALLTKRPRINPWNHEWLDVWDMVLVKCYERMKQQWWKMHPLVSFSLFASDFSSPLLPLSGIVCFLGGFSEGNATSQTAWWFCWFQGSPKISKNPYRSTQCKHILVLHLLSPSRIYWRHLNKSERIRW